MARVARVDWAMILLISLEALESVEKVGVHVTGQPGAGHSGQPLELELVQHTRVELVSGLRSTTINVFCMLRAECRAWQI